MPRVLGANRRGSVSDVTSSLECQNVYVEKECALVQNWGCVAGVHSAKSRAVATMPAVGLTSVAKLAGAEMKLELTRNEVGLGELRAVDRQQLKDSRSSVVSPIPVKAATRDSSESTTQSPSSVVISIPFG